MENGAVTWDGEESVGNLHGNEVGGEAAPQAVRVDMLALIEGSVATEGESALVLFRGEGRKRRRKRGEGW